VTQLAQLDYPDAKILMEAETPIEQSYRLRACAKEPWTVALIEEIPPAGVFYDVGANVGSYSLIAAARGVVTVAVEPSFANVGALCRNLMRNGCEERVIVLPVALADIRGLPWFDYQDVRQGAASHVLGGKTRQFFHRMRIPTLPLDLAITLFGLPAPTHIKIDVDGTELPVLRGMAETLRGEALAALLIEMPHPLEMDITALLAEAGWQLAERFGERNGQPIANVVYGRFAR
jgi:FkbM family methyltransferase